METVSHKKRISKRDRKLQKKGVDLEVDLVVTSLAGEALFSGALPHDTTVKFLRDAVQETIAGIVIDGLLHGDQCLQLSQTLGAAGIASGATLHAVFGSLRGDFKVEGEDRKNCIFAKSRTAVSVQPGDRQSFEEAFGAVLYHASTGIFEKRSAAEFQEVVAIENEEQHRCFMGDSRLELKDEWKVVGRNANGDELPPIDAMQPRNERTQQHALHVYPIHYTLERRTTKVSEIVECKGPVMLELLCKSTNGLTYDMALTRVPNDTATGARLKSFVKSAKSVAYFTYTEKLGGFGYTHDESVAGMEVLVGGHRLSMSQTRVEYF